MYLVISNSSTNYPLKRSSSCTHGRPISAPLMRRPAAPASPRAAGGGAPLPPRPTPDPAAAGAAGGAQRGYVGFAGRGAGYRRRGGGGTRAGARPGAGAGEQHADVAPTAGLQWRAAFHHRHGDGELLAQPRRGACPTRPRRGTRAGGGEVARRGVGWRRGEARQGGRARGLPLGDVREEPRAAAACPRLSGLRPCPVRALLCLASCLAARRFRGSVLACSPQPSSAALPRNVGAGPAAWEPCAGERGGPSPGSSARSRGQVTALSLRGRKVIQCIGTAGC